MRFIAISIATSVAAFHASSSIAAAAEAITYKGTLGTLPVIVELVSPAEDGTFVGRYSYRTTGIDIPLHGMAHGKQGVFSLEEEKPCDKQTCLNKDGTPVDKAPLGATWMLNESADGARLEGTWQEKGSNKKMSVALQRAAVRDIADPGNGLDALDPSSVVNAQNPPAFLSETDLPYDFAKMAHAFNQGKTYTAGENSYRMDTDPLTGLDYPVVLAIGVENTRPIDTWLTQQRLQWSLPAFSCRSKAYLGFGWTEELNGSTTGYEGGGGVTVQYLSERLMGIAEAGSYWCGGAYPENFSRHLIADVKTGKAIELEQLLKGWWVEDRNGRIVDPEKFADRNELIYHGPSDELIAYILKHRQKFDEQTESECGIDDLVRSNLGVYLAGDNLVFTLKDLPHVIFACTDDLLKVPVKDARDLLTEKGASYFAELDR